MSAQPEAETRAADRRGQGLLAAKVVLIAAVLNLVLLFSALAYNIVRTYF
jgi:hypothetical protein